MVLNNEDGQESEYVVLAEWSSTPEGTVNTSDSV